MCTKDDCVGAINELHVMKVGRTSIICKLSNAGEIQDALRRLEASRSPVRIRYNTATGSISVMNPGSAGAVTATLRATDA